MQGKIGQNQALERGDWISLNGGEDDRLWVAGVYAQMRVTGLSAVADYLGTG